MALTTYHHGITATETSNITPIIKSVSMSTIALVSVSDDADDTAYPFDTPVLLTGITSTDVEKSGSDDQLLHQCLRTIKAIQNTSVVVLRLSEPVDVDTVDLLLSCQTSLGVTPKILIAPEIDTPAMTRKLVEIAKKRRAFVYASPRAEDGTLITVKEDIAAYRDTFAARELMLIEGAFGEPGKSQSPDGSDDNQIYCTPTTTLATLESLNTLDDSLVHARYRINDGEWVNYQSESESAPASLADEILNFLSSIKVDADDIKDVTDFGDLDMFFGIRLFNVIAHNPVTAFNARFGDDSIRGASRSLVDNNAYIEGHPNIDSIVSNQPTKVEFAVTENNENDLVYAIFGKSETVYSCAFVAWKLPDSV